MTEVITERQAAFEHLAETVRGLQSRGQSTMSAGVKPALRYSMPEFDERRLGFRSFRDFVTAAADAGYVAFGRAERGPDVVLSVTTTTTSGHKVPELIRRDLWTAFVDWRRDWLRVYDRESERVGWLPANESPHEFQDFAALRRGVAASPERYVSISPLTPNDTQELIRAFVEERIDDAVIQKAFTSANASAKPIRAFIRATQELGLVHEWRTFRLERVRKVIEEWGNANKLDLDLSANRELLTTARGERAGANRRRIPRHASVGQPEAISTQWLRSRVEEAVRRMSRGELMRLPIPIEYLLDDGDISRDR